MVLHFQQTVAVPKGLKAQIKNRKVTVVGPRGTLSKTFAHIPLDMRVTSSGSKIIVNAWNCRKAHTAAVRTVCSHIKNMFTGVTDGYQYKMRLVHSHFPMTTEIKNEGKTIEVGLFIGEKNKRVVDMLPGVEIAVNPELPTELILQGNDVENVSHSAAAIHQSLKCRNKDLRKFLDGIYVSEAGTIPAPDADE